MEFTCEAHLFDHTKGSYKNKIDLSNRIDANIKLNVQFGCPINFLDLYVENINGSLFTKVYHKPSHEPSFFPFNSIHHTHMKRNIPYEILLRGVKYCSTFEAYVNECDQLRISLLLNKYPDDFINKQFNRLLNKLNIDQPIDEKNYHEVRNRIIQAPMKKENTPIDFRRLIFVHFTYCSNMKIFPSKFHTLREKYFAESPINDIKPILGIRNVNNLQQQLIFNK